MELRRGKWKLYTEGAKFIVERDGQILEVFPTRQEFNDWVYLFTQFQANRTGVIPLPPEPKKEEENKQSNDNPMTGFNF